MANAFLENYWFNNEITPNCIDLQKIEKKSWESFVSMPRGGERRSLKCTPMTEEETIKWFLDNLKPPYYEKIISVQVPHFASLISIRECMDEGIISKRIINPTILYSLME